MLQLIHGRCFLHGKLFIETQSLTAPREALCQFLQHQTCLLLTLVPVISSSTSHAFSNRMAPYFPSRRVWSLIYRCSYAPGLTSEKNFLAIENIQKFALSMFVGNTFYIYMSPMCFLAFCRRYVYAESALHYS